MQKISFDNYEISNLSVPRVTITCLLFLKSAVVEFRKEWTC